MIDKYGEEVLRELEEEKQNKEEKEAAVSLNTKCKSDCRFFVKLFGCVIFYFCKHNLLKSVNIWKYHFFASGMKLTNFFHTCCYFIVNGMLNRNRIIISSMYMVKIVISDWKHILEKKSSFFSIKFT